MSIKKTNIEKTLLAETRKWLKKLEKDSHGVAQKNQEDEKTKEQIENICAYISDCKHFIEKGDLVRAFEAVVYAWGIFETLKRLGLV